MRWFSACGWPVPRVDASARQGEIIGRSIQRPLKLCLSIRRRLTGDPPMTSIRPVFLLSFALVALPGLLLSGWMSWVAWSDTASASRAILATRTYAEVAQAQATFAVQTGNISALVTTPAPDTTEARQGQELTLRRLRLAESAVAAAGLDTTPVRNAIRALEELARRALEAAAKPPAERDQTILRDLVAARAQVGNGLSTVGQQAARGIHVDAPDISDLIEVAQAVTALREAAGQRALTLTQFVSGTRPEPAAVASLHQLTGRIAAAWDTVERLVTAGNLPRLVAALQQQRQDYLQTAEPRWRRQVDIAMRRMSGGNDDFGVTAEDNRNFSRPTLAKVLELRDAALEEAVAAAEAMYSAAWTRFGVGIAAALGSLALLIAGFTLLGHRIVTPLIRLTGTVGRIAGGELTLEVPGRGRSDELGRMASAVEDLRAASAQRAALQAAQDAEREARIARAARVDALLRGFESETAAVLRTVASAATELDATASGMADTARHGASRASAVAEAAQLASGNVQSVASATEELSASIREVVRQIEAGATAAREATAAAEATDATVRGLSEAASRIGDVVRLIGDIASQTNLLALNATIEAARAGEAGKGFAVVASEVKQLAAQTAKATEEIGSQISAMQAETGRTVEVVRAISQTIGRLSAATAQVADTASQQAAATQEIGSAVARAATGTQDASHHAEGVSRDAESTGAAAAEVRQASAELARQAEGLRGQVDRFLGAIRAA
jgi:methyl-accepting chemotaxis protein